MTISVDETRAIAKEAFIYGFPDDKAIQSPNSDTPYSYVGADLRAEPLVFTMLGDGGPDLCEFEPIDQFDASTRRASQCGRARAHSRRLAL